MIQVIKQGKKLDPIQTKKCSKCSTKFSFNNADIKPDFRDGSYVVCPTCGNFISAQYLPK